MNAQEWLTRAAGRLVHDRFEPAGFDLNPNTGEPLSERLIAQRGYPTAKALRRDDKNIGQCVPSAASAGGNTEIFVSPVLGRGSPMPGGDNPKTVLMTLAHEICHAAVDFHKDPHGPEFVKVIKAINIVKTHYDANDPRVNPKIGPIAGTEIDARFAGSDILTISDDFSAYCDELLRDIGDYDFDAITMETMPRASTKLLKCVCKNPDCPSQPRGYTVRLTWYWAKQGTPFCGICNERMSVYLPRAKGQSGKGAGDKDPNAQPVAIGSGGYDDGSDDSRDDVPMHTDPDDESGDAGDDEGSPRDGESDGQGKAGDDGEGEPQTGDPDEEAIEDHTDSGTDAGSSKKGQRVKGDVKRQTKGGKAESGNVPDKVIQGPHKVSLKCACDICSNARKLAGLEV